MPRCFYNPDSDIVTFRIFANSIEEFNLTAETAEELRDDITKALDDRSIRHHSWHMGD